MVCSDGGGEQVVGDGQVHASEDERLRLHILARRSGSSLNYAVRLLMRLLRMKRVLKMENLLRN